MRRMHRLMLLISIGVPILALDRLSKLWAQNWLAKQPDGAAPAWPGVFGWLYARNTGVAFSALSGKTTLLIVIGFAAIVGIVAYILLAKSMDLRTLAALSMVASGGAGNLWDRLLHGYVVDFIHLEFMRFAVFNAADIFVSCGAVLLILSLMCSAARDTGEART